MKKFISILCVLSILGAQTNTLIDTPIYNWLQTVTTNTFKSKFIQEGAPAPFAGMLLNRDYSAYALECMQVRTNITLLEQRVFNRELLVKDLEWKITNLTTTLSNVMIMNGYFSGLITSMDVMQKNNTWITRNLGWIIPCCILLGGLIAGGCFYLGQVNFANVSVESVRGFFSLTNK